MRSHQRIYVPGSEKKGKRSLKWRIMEPLKARFLDCWQHNAHKKGIASPDGLLVCLNMSDNRVLENVFPKIRWKHHYVAEYVIHPAAENDSPYFGKIVDQRMHEYRLFTSEETKRLLERENIQLVNYDAIKPLMRIKNG